MAEQQAAQMQNQLNHLMTQMQRLTGELQDSRQRKHTIGKVEPLASLQGVEIEVSPSTCLLTLLLRDPMCVQFFHLQGPPQSVALLAATCLKPDLGKAKYPGKLLKEAVEQVASCKVFYCEESIQCTGKRGPNETQKPRSREKRQKPRSREASDCIDCHI